MLAASPVGCVELACGTDMSSDRPLSASKVAFDVCPWSSSTLCFESDGPSVKVYVVGSGDYSDAAIELALDSSGETVLV